MPNIMCPNAVKPILIKVLSDALRVSTSPLIPNIVSPKSLAKISAIWRTKLPLSEILIPIRVANIVPQQAIIPNNSMQPLLNREIVITMAVSKNKTHINPIITTNHRITAFNVHILIPAPPIIQGKPIATIKVGKRLACTCSLIISKGLTGIMLVKFAHTRSLTMRIWEGTPEIIQIITTTIKSRFKGKLYETYR